MMTEPLDPVLLRTFLAVVREGNFTRAAASLGLGQPTVSQHVQRLEAAAGRRLLVRDTHTLATTADGDAMADFARAILAADARARRYFAGVQLRGRLRFGASDDVVLSRLPGVLRDFMRDHPLVDLELTVGLSGLLYERLDRGELDLVYCKRRPGDDRGRLVWRDRLVWLGQRPVDPAAPLPLILYPPPSLTRGIALSALAAHGRSWRIACTAGSLSGLHAAALAELGVMPHARALAPAGLAELPPDAGLPELGEIDFVVVSAQRAPRGPAAALAEALAADAAGGRISEA
jgi:DNA-binding transcriptional LysR family regulator